MSTEVAPKKRPKASKPEPRRSEPTGRTARTKGVSMLPDELRDATTVEELTGVGFTEVYRRHFAPQMRSAAELLLEAHNAGVELNRAVLRDTWDITMSAHDLVAVYRDTSELTLGE